MVILRKKNTTAKKHYLYYWCTGKLKPKINKLNVYSLLWVRVFKHIKVLNKINSIAYSKLITPVSSVYMKVTKIWSFLNTRTADENTHFMLFIEQNNMAWSLIRLNRLNSMFSYVIDLKRFKTVYTAGYGNYVLNVRYNKSKKIVTFILPSKKQLVTSEWVIGVAGRNPFYLLNDYIATSSKTRLRRHRNSVRGVAKNPVDHHNGGRNKRKPLFLNKYNKIAKKGK